MALTVIARGELDRAPLQRGYIFRTSPGSKYHILHIDDILRPYIGQTLVISLEEEELEPIISERLKRVLVEG